MNPIEKMELGGYLTSTCLLYLELLRELEH